MQNESIMKVAGNISKSCGDLGEKILDGVKLEEAGTNLLDPRDGSFSDHDPI